MFYTYLYIDPRNDQPFYVGKGCNERSQRHLWRKDKHTVTAKIQSMKKEGIQPIIHIMECSNEQIAFQLEIGLIRLLGRKDLNTGPLLNLTDGGDDPPSAKGKKRSPEYLVKRKATVTALGKDHWMRRPEARAKMMGNNNRCKNRQVTS